MNGSVRVAAVGDLHCKRSSSGFLQTLFSRIGENADVLALCGDLTDRGLADEARLDVEAAYGSHDLEPLTDESQRCILVLRRRIANVDGG